MKERISIITACSRSRNLSKLWKSIEPGLELFDVDWIIVYDTTKTNVVPFENARVYGVSDFESQAGNAQKNYGLTKVEDGHNWVYFLDDDNLIHPDFWSLLNACSQQTRYPVVVMAQDLFMGVRMAHPALVHVGGIDHGQVVYRKRLLDGRQLKTGLQYADGLLNVSLYNEDPERFLFSGQPTTFYNALIEAGKCPVPIYQDHVQLRQLREIVKSAGVKNILEIGSMYGGTLWCWFQSLDRCNVTSIDLPVTEADDRYDGVTAARGLWNSWANEANGTLDVIVGNSMSKESIARAKKNAPYDFIFIDGGHDYETVKNDFLNYWPMLRIGGIMAFHDISYPENTENLNVRKLWLKLIDEFPFVALENPGVDVWGIGLIEKVKENADISL